MPSALSGRTLCQDENLVNPQNTSQHFHSFCPVVAPCVPVRTSWMEPAMERNLRKRHCHFHSFKIFLSHVNWLTGTRAPFLTGLPVCFTKLSALDCQYVARAILKQRGIDLDIKHFTHHWAGEAQREKRGCRRLASKLPCTTSCSSGWLGGRGYNQECFNKGEK